MSIPVYIRSFLEMKKILHNFLPQYLLGSKNVPQELEPTTWKA